MGTGLQPVAHCVTDSLLDLGHRSVYSVPRKSSIHMNLQQNCTVHSSRDLPWLALIQRACSWVISVVGSEVLPMHSPHEY